jgi:hypothetical protein
VLCDVIIHASYTGIICKIPIGIIRRKQSHCTGNVSICLRRSKIERQRMVARNFQIKKYRVANNGITGSRIADSRITKKGGGETGISGPSACKPRTAVWIEGSTTCTRLLR